MKSIWFIPLFIWPIAALASGESCITINSDLDRLACYDKELGRTPKVEITRPEKSTWQVQTEKSKLTDQTDVYVSVVSGEIVDCGFNNTTVILNVRCVESTTALVLTTSCHMTSSEYDSYGVVEYRLDGDKARKAQMQESTNNKSLGLWSGGASIPVIKSMFGKRQMIVRATPYGENPFTATFDITGLESAIAPLRKACGW